MINRIAEHVEYLLRRHDCVVLPGMGAFLCNYEAARFDGEQNDLLLPPSRWLAFNQMITDSDGLLVGSVARKDGVSVACAGEKVQEALDFVWQELVSRGECCFGRLGTFYRSDNQELFFEASAVPSINGSLYGLRPVMLHPVEQVVGDCESRVASQEGELQGDETVMLPAPVRWRAYASGIVASLAVVVTAVLFLISPIQTGKEVREAAIAPIPKAEKPVDNQEDGIAVTSSRLTVEGIALPSNAAETPSQPVEAVTQSGKEVGATAVNSHKIEKPEGVVARYNDSDAYCVVVASFPTRGQAEAYLKGHGNRQLGLLEKDSKFRIYAATGRTFDEANSQKSTTGQADAWVCRR